MERKLLSLPSFFVLLLVAGIAFLATPVVDVQAQTAPTATVERVTITPADMNGATAGTALETGGAKDLFIVKFNTPVNVASADASIKFDAVDLKVTVTDTSPAATSASSDLVPSRITVNPIPTTAAAPLNGAPAANQWFVVNLAVPANGTGELRLSVRGSTATPAGAFQAADTGVWATTADTPAVAMFYDTYDGDAPTVVITAGAGATGTGTGAAQVITVTGDTGDNDVFQLKVAFADAKFAASQALVMSEVSVATTKPAPTTENPEGSRVVGVWADSATPASLTAATYIVAIDPADGAMEVEITVDEDAFTDASENGNAETKKKVTINARPTVTIALASGVTPPLDRSVTEFDVVFTLSAEPAPGTGNTAFVEEDVTVTNGELKGKLKPNRGVEGFIWNATVMLPAWSARKTPVEVLVAADAFEAAATGIDNTASNTLSVTVDVPDPDTAPPPATEDPTGVGGDLTDNKEGFSFSVTVRANEFVVLAKSPGNAGFTSAAGNFAINYDTSPPTLPNLERIDIADDKWVDLRHFLVGREGGAIDLIGPAGVKVRSLVISEVMWGNDNGLSTPSDSQWIELYNTTGAQITGTWMLEFSNKSKGRGMLANDVASTTDNPVVDKLSTWRNVGSTWAWQINDTPGGTHGQSGKSTINSATSPGSPSEIISMQRKIDYIGKVEKAGNDRTAQLKDFPDGAASGGWEASKEHGDLLPYRKGTPGKKPIIRTFTQTPVPRGSVVFNEIANRSNKTHDWIELYNKTSSDKKINGWALSSVSAKGTDNELFTFTSDNDINVPGGGYLLVVNTTPANTPLEGGYNVIDPGSSERARAASRRPYYVTDKLDIPKENFLLILRHGSDKRGTKDKIEDIAGNNPDFGDPDINTEVWPLESWTLGAKDDLGENNDKTWVRDQGKAVFNGDEWKPDGGFTGVGIKRRYDSGDSYTSGTPGYANNAVQNEVKSDGLTETTAVVISEIMFATDGRAPQWIELHNPSLEQAVNLDKWKLEVFNYRGTEFAEELKVNDYAELMLPKRHIQPNQTVLIVSRETSRMSGSDEFPDNRIIGVWDEPTLRKAFDMQSRNDAILSSIGFHLKLSDPKDKEVDTVGNIDDNRRNSDERAWTLPDGSSEEGARSSMVRAEGTENNGAQEDSWIDADIFDPSSLNTDANELYYGDPDDVGTPGYTPGGVLPVQLSSFYSKRSDAGAVIITWATESELDNAGFNILRSTSRSGEFTKINAQLIPGAGTTGEKSAYTWTDTSAKPNVLYFYQIEDVSLDGAHRTLRTTRLRGHIGAHGKLTTTWGDLKSRE